MNDHTLLAWETDQPGRLRDLLAAVGFRARPGGSLAIPGLVLAVASPIGADRLRPALPRDVGREAPPDGPAGEPGGPRLRAVAVATVDLERAGASYAGLLGELPGDEILGARIATTGVAGVVLAEPTTEGRLAATLARHGEGPAAFCVAVPWAAIGAIRRRLVELGERPRDGAGPFGPQVLARARPPWGPHLLVVPEAPGVATAPVDDPPSPRTSGTINP